MATDRGLLSRIFIYPVKSLGGISVETAELTPEGLQHDRRWMLVDEENRFLTQRVHPQMSQIETAIREESLILSLRGQPGNSVRISLYKKASPREEVSIWSDVTGAEEESPEISQWLSDHLGMKCRLMKKAERSARRVDAAYAPGHTVGFADGFPFLIVNEASLQNLNDHLEMQVGVERFRPNLVVSGFPAFSEDGWKRLRIGENVFEAVKPCGRCVMVNVDPVTSLKSKEPLQTLARLHTKGNKVIFGMNAVRISGDRVTAGQAVEHF